MSTISDALKLTMDEVVDFPTDHYYTGGEWVTPCMCGHHSHGYTGHCEHMSCDTDDCDCGGYEQQPGCARPIVRREGEHPFFRMLRRVSSDG